MALEQVVDRLRSVMQDQGSFVRKSKAVAEIVLAFAQQQDKEGNARYIESILNEIAIGKDQSVDELKSDIREIAKQSGQDVKTILQQMFIDLYTFKGSVVTEGDLGALSQKVSQIERFILDATNFPSGIFGTVRLADVYFNPRDAQGNIINSIPDMIAAVGARILKAQQNIADLNAKLASGDFENILMPRFDKDMPSGVATIESSLRYFDQDDGEYDRMVGVLGEQRVKDLKIERKGRIARLEEAQRYWARQFKISEGNSQWNAFVQDMVSLQRQWLEFESASRQIVTDQERVYVAMERYGFKGVSFETVQEIIGRQINSEGQRIESLNQDKAMLSRSEGIKISDAGKFPGYGGLPLVPLEWDTAKLGAQPANVRTIPQARQDIADRIKKINEKILPYLDNVAANPDVISAAKTAYERLKANYVKERDQYLPLVVEGELDKDEALQVAAKAGLPPVESDRQVLDRKVIVRQAELDLDKERLDILTALNGMGIDVFTEEFGEKTLKILDFKRDLSLSALTTVTSYLGVDRHPLIKLMGELGTQGVLGAAHTSLLEKKFLAQAEREMDEAKKKAEAALMTSVQNVQEYRRALGSIKETSYKHVENVEKSRTSREQVKRSLDTFLGGFIRAPPQAGIEQMGDGIYVKGKALGKDLVVLNGSTRIDVASAEFFETVEGGKKVLKSNQNFAVAKPLGDDVDLDVFLGTVRAKHDGASDNTYFFLSTDSLTPEAYENTLHSFGVGVMENKVFEVDAQSAALPEGEAPIGQIRKERYILVMDSVVYDKDRVSGGLVGIIKVNGDNTRRTSAAAGFIDTALRPTTRLILEMGVAHSVSKDKARLTIEDPLSGQVVVDEDITVKTKDTADVQKITLQQDVAKDLALTLSFARFHTGEFMDLFNGETKQSFLVGANGKVEPFDGHPIYFKAEQSFAGDERTSLTGTYKRLSFDYLRTDETTAYGVRAKIYDGEQTDVEVGYKIDPQGKNSVTANAVHEVNETTRANAGVGTDSGIAGSLQKEIPLGKAKDAEEKKPLFVPEPYDPEHNDLDKTAAPPGSDSKRQKGRSELKISDDRSKFFEGKTTVVGENPDITFIPGLPAMEHYFEIFGENSEYAGGAKFLDSQRFFTDNLAGLTEAQFSVARPLWAIPEAELTAANIEYVPGVGYFFRGGKERIFLGAGKATVILPKDVEEFDVLRKAGDTFKSAYLIIVEPSKPMLLKMQKYLEGHGYIPVRGVGFVPLDKERLEGILEGKEFKEGDNSYQYIKADRVTGRRDIRKLEVVYGAAGDTAKSKKAPLILGKEGEKFMKKFTSERYLLIEQDGRSYYRTLQDMLADKERLIKDHVQIEKNVEGISTGRVYLGVEEAEVLLGVGRSVIYHIEEGKTTEEEQPAIVGPTPPAETPAVEEDIRNIEEELQKTNEKINGVDQEIEQLKKQLEQIRGKQKTSSPQPVDLPAPQILPVRPPVMVPAAPVVPFNTPMLLGNVFEGLERLMGINEAYAADQPAPAPAVEPAAEEKAVSSRLEALEAKKESLLAQAARLENKLRAVKTGASLHLGLKTFPRPVAVGEELGEDMVRGQSVVVMRRDDLNVNGNPYKTTFEALLQPKGENDPWPNQTVWKQTRDKRADSYFDGTNREALGLPDFVADRSVTRITQAGTFSMVYKGEPLQIYAPAGEIFSTGEVVKPYDPVTGKVTVRMTSGIFKVNGNWLTWEEVIDVRGDTAEKFDGEMVGGGFRRDIKTVFKDGATLGLDRNPLKEGTSYLLFDGTKLQGSKIIRVDQENGDVLSQTQNPLFGQVWQQEDDAYGRFIRKYDGVMENGKFIRQRESEPAYDVGSPPQGPTTGNNQI